MASAMSAPLRSLRRNISPPMASQRPLSCQISAGCSTGMSISWQPMASISSRMICSIFCMTRQPAGRYT